MIMQIVQVFETAKAEKATEETDKNLGFTLWASVEKMVNINNKRAQRALGRSPEEKVKGNSGANIENPRGIIWTTLVKDLLMMLYIKYESTGPCSFRQEDLW